jgi:hypothetical protein
MAMPDEGISRDLLGKALKKGAFVVGAENAKGIIACRNKGPSTIRIEGGSFGFLIRGSGGGPKPISCRTPRCFPAFVRIRTGRTTGSFMVEKCGDFTRQAAGTPLGSRTCAREPAGRS